MTDAVIREWAVGILLAFIVLAYFGGRIEQRRNDLGQIKELRAEKRALQIKIDDLKRISQ